MKRSWLRAVSLFALTAAVACGCESSHEDEGVQTDGSEVTVGGEVIRAATGKVSEVKLVNVPGSNVRIATWTETANGIARPFYAIDLGQGFLEAKQTSYDVPLRTRTMDPKNELPTESKSPLHVVQYVSQPLEAFTRLVEAAGGEVHQYVHGNAQIVRGDEDALARIAKLPFVRATSTVNPLDKIDPVLTRRDPAKIPVVVVLVDGQKDRAAVESTITALGGTITVSDPLGILVEAELSASAIPQLSDRPEVLWIEQGGAAENDYDIANQQGGGEYLQSLDDARPNLPGYTGIGIIGHILEGIDPNHADFAATEYRTKPVGIDQASSDSHGMQTFGIVFGSGAGNPRARGLLPNGQGFYTHNKAVMSAPIGGRSTLVGKLISENHVMFQTASWGQPTIKTYSAKSAEMDALILLHDLPITQSQSNTGSQTSRPQAWAKNIISVGALNHYGTLSMDDDKWSRSGSIGPAADGSIKPDVCFYYDKTITTALGSAGYSQSFGGTSGATPTVAGHVGLSIELWTNGVFGNPLLPRAAGESIADWRFKNRPHAMTTKALIIHTARQHQFEGETHDRTRTHQGWGIPSVEDMYKRRTNMLVVNQTDVLTNLAKKTYSIVVPAGAPDFRATMVYPDKEASVPTTIHRINNVDLKVTAPDGTIYWGNNGLKANMFSTPGGVHNTLDTVENVLVKAPAAGTWKVEVIADELNADTHKATAAVDTSYALVVSSAPN